MCTITAMSCEVNYCAFSSTKSTIVAAGSLTVFTIQCTLVGGDMLAQP